MKDRRYPRRGLHGEIVHGIGVRILRGELRPGDPLPGEAELGSELGVSRTVLREAVKVLAAKGLVEPRPKTGTRVRARHFWNLLDPDVLAWRLEAGADERFFPDLIEVRLLIEPAAARLAALRATDKEIELLESLYAEMAEAVDDVEAYVGADLRFHAAILSSCHNELLEQLSGTLRAVFRASFALTTSLPGASASALPRHRAIVEAIAGRDEDEAETATRALIDHTAAEIRSALVSDHAVPTAEPVR